MFNFSGSFTLKDFDGLLSQAFSSGVSDIVLKTGDVGKVKLNGVMTPFTKRIIQNTDLSSVLREIHTPSAPDVLKTEPLDFRHSILLDDDSVIRFRVSATQCQGLLDETAFVIVLRTIPDDPPSVDDLKIESEIRKAMSNKFGLFLVTGPTGSGKTTTIASLLSMVAFNEAKHILTYEAPIEYVLADEDFKSTVAQTEVYTMVPDFPSAIANALRRAPDIILLGEARDKESIEGAVRAALTGHFVLSTVHTNSVEQTIARMADEFDRAYYKTICAALIDSMRGILHQRLYPKLGGGRVALRSFLIFTDSIRNKLLSQLASVDDVSILIRKMVAEYGQTLSSDANNKFRQGYLGLSDYLSVLNEVGPEPNYTSLMADIEFLRKKGSVDEVALSEWELAIEEMNNV